MNFLAHFYLAMGNEGLIVGNLLADHVKGKRYRNLPLPYQHGVLLHRKIDDFTDKHPEVMKTKERLRNEYGKYAPVIADVFYDYILGHNWEDYSNITLKEFSSEIYTVLQRHEHSFPPEAQLTLAYMSKNDWLFHYSTYYGIEMALKGLSRRATFESKMGEALNALKRDEGKIEEEFRSFFTDLQIEVKNEIKKF